MFVGKIIFNNGKPEVHLIDAPLVQKVYPLGKIASLTIIDNLESKIVEVELIPNQGEMDEQPEYTARIVKPLINFYDN